MARPAACALAVLPCAMVLAAPLAEPAQRLELVAAQEIAAGAADSAESPVDVQSWVQRETTQALLEGTSEADRLAMLRQGWKERSPTWIQDAEVVNLADFPTLDRSTERAERDLKTLDWVLEQQRRQAEGQTEPDASRVADPPQDNWLRNLLPRQWISAVKAHREWVAAGGAVLLLVVWGTTVFARRPSATRMTASPPPAASKHRRQRRHRHDLERMAG